MSEWKKYRRTNLAEMRAIDPKESLGLVSVSAPDAELFNTDCEEFNRGFIARNPANHADQWYVARAYFDANFEPIEESN